jgi:hypothetical protein
LCVNPLLKEYLISKFGNEWYEGTKTMTSETNKYYPNQETWGWLVTTTWDHVISKPNWICDYKDLSMNPNITIDIVLNNRDKPWDYNVMFTNPSIHPNMIIKHFSDKLDFRNLCPKIKSRNIRWYDAVFDINEPMVSVIYNSFDASNAGMKIQHVFRRWRRKINLEKDSTFLHNIMYEVQLPLELCVYINYFTTEDKEFMIEDDYYKEYEASKKSIFYI